MFLQSGIFLSAFKTALVKPWLKKPDLDFGDLSHYRPISNLPFQSKLIENIFFNQLLHHLNTNNILDEFQSGYQTNHSTETALLKVVNDLKTLTDLNNVAVLFLLDLSAAFDTIDHSI